MFGCQILKCNDKEVLRRKLKINEMSTEGVKRTKTIRRERKEGKKEGVRSKKGENK